MFIFVALEAPMKILMKAKVLAVSCNITTSLKAELLAIYHGLHKVWDDGFRMVL